MNLKTCTMCNIEKHIKNFYKKYSECKDCKRTRGLNCYSENKDKTSNQQKIKYEKKEIKYYDRNKNKRCIQFKDLVRFYVEIENRLTAVEEN